MPKKYIAKKKGKYVQHNYEHMAEAVKAVKAGEMSVRLAAERYGLPKSTLYDRVSGRFDLDTKPGRKPVLDTATEDQILKNVTENAEKGFGLSRQQLLTRAGILCKRANISGFRNGTPSKHWWYGLKRRHPEIGLRKPEKLGTVRARMLNSTVVERYLKDLGTIISEHNLINTPQKIWNCDETGKHLEHNPERAYKRLPLEACSRLFGRLSEVELWDGVREPLLGFYVRYFNVDLSEAADEDLSHYSSIGEFFRRPLKPGARPVDELYDLTCPSDGRILHFGEVQNGKLEQVKGVSYSLRQFLGHSTWINGPLTENVQFLSDEEYYQSLQIRPGNSLYYCIVYLAPGNYHRFHSAADWTITYRRHFPGNLLSVSPWIAERVQDLFNYNERVVYFGTWKHGLFTYIPVGATNVGSIKIYCDKDLATNRTENKRLEFIDKVYPEGVKVKKGDMFGEFNMGSTVVLVFEAPKDFKFTCENRQHVKCGIALGNDRRVDSEKDQQKTNS